MSLAYYPQIWKIIKSKSAEDISISTFLIFGIGTATLFFYGWQTNDAVIMASFALGIIGSWATLFLTLYYRKKEKMGEK